MFQLDYISFFFLENLFLISLISLSLSLSLSRSLFLSLFLSLSLSISLSLSLSLSLCNLKRKKMMLVYLFMGDTLHGREIAILWWQSTILK